MTNFERFTHELESAYKILFDLPLYAITAKKYTPGEFAIKMSRGLYDGQAHNDGEGVRMACKACGIKSTYKSIISYFGN